MRVFKCLKVSKGLKVHRFKGFGPFKGFIGLQDLKVVVFEGLKVSDGLKGIRPLKVFIPFEGLHIHDF